MESIFTGILAEIAKYGAPGLAIAYLLWKNERLQSRLDAIAEKRAEERGQSIAVLAAASEAQKQLADSTQDQAAATTLLAERTSAILDVVRNLVQTIEPAGRRGR